MPDQYGALTAALEDGIFAGAGAVGGHVPQGFGLRETGRR